MTRLAQDPTVQQLLTIAQAKIEAEQAVLITGKASELDASALSIADEAAAELPEIAERQLRRHDGLARCGAGYTAARVTLTAQNANMDDERATILAVAFSELTYRSSPMSAPVQTGEAPKHIFSFKRGAEGWLLTRDEPQTFPRGAPPPTNWWDRFVAPPRNPGPPVTPPACTRPASPEG